MDTMSAITDVLRKPYGIMGIVNVTPDSFFDGGRYADIGAAVIQAKRLAAEGADILDIGGASSRPGADVVPPEDEAGRIIPVIRVLAEECKESVISVDTTHASVARSALDAGASVINDISAGRGDPRMRALAAESGCTVVLMHSRGTPQSMQRETGYEDVVSEAKKELLEAVEKFLKSGVERERIILDPGIGFAKTPAQNVAILHGLRSFTETGFPVMVGTSRKSFIGHLTGREVTDRLYGTLGSVASAFFRGARIFRVHDVAETKDLLKVLSAIERYGE
jgi:dihydropteroate synthase